MKQADVLIVGSGIAALQLASTLENDINVMVLTKSSITKGNSHMAQGGVAAALGEGDDPYKHYLDTIEAGRYHNNPAAVLELTKEAPSLINGLFNEGCRFDANKSGDLLLGMEGAHSEKRIVHCGGDATGKEIVEFLVSRLRNNITVEEDVFVFELLIDESGKCIGVKGLLADGTTETYFSPYVVLATGGCGQLYSFTSNEKTVTGDGLALAYRAGAELVDMEFIQFHPTLLYIDGKTKGLVSEAVRGEGARLVTNDGHHIMTGIHPLADLAPRHIVSQTIYDYLKNGQQIYLDITSLTNFSKRFPTVTALCREAGVDLDKGLIPVAPGSHFLMGGIRTDGIGRTSIAGLYAIGEVACTGVHGANRLASNSLLEGMVYGRRLGRWINNQPCFADHKLWVNNSQSIQSKTHHWIGMVHDSSEGRKRSLPDIEVLQQTMMDRTGIIRHNAALTMQKQWLESHQVEAWLDVRLDKYTPEEISKVFMLITAWLITEAALARTESRGGHYREDYPLEDHSIWMNNRITFKRKTEKDGHREQIKTAFTT